jgi:hypothetical protein
MDTVTLILNSFCRIEILIKSLDRLPDDIRIRLLDFVRFRGCRERSY